MRKETEKINKKDRKKVENKKQKRKGIWGIDEEEEEENKKIEKERYLRNR